MGLPELIELGGLFLIAGTKFAVAAGLLVSPAITYTYFESVLLLICGGFTGILFFYFFSNWINKIIDRFFKRQQQRFSKKTRRFINIKNKYGLIGLSLLTPILLSIPVGTFIASRFYPKTPPTVLIMLAGIFLWALLIPLIKFSY